MQEKKYLDVQIKYSHPNSGEVKNLVEAFWKADRLGSAAVVKSFFDYIAICAIPDENPVTEQDIDKLRQLGAKVVIRPSV